MVELAFYRGRGTWWDALVRLRTWGPYSRCELHFPRLGAVFSASAALGRTRFATAHVLDGQWDCFAIEDADPWLERALMLWCKRREGLPYDYAGELQLPWPRGRGPQRWHCGLLCASALSELEVVALPCRISPNRLARLVAATPQVFLPVVG